MAMRIGIFGDPEAAQPPRTRPTMMCRLRQPVAITTHPLRLCSSPHRQGSQRCRMKSQQKPPPERPKTPPPVRLAWTPGDISKAKPPPYPLALASPAKPPPSKAPPTCTASPKNPPPPRNPPPLVFDSDDDSARNLSLPGNIIVRYGMENGKFRVDVNLLSTSDSSGSNGHEAVVGYTRSFDLGRM